MIRQKKAFELSINFLVVMIIMIVIFSFGIYLFTNVFNHVVKMDTEIHQQEIDRINLLLDDGSLVTVLNPQQNSGKDELRFPIGITNEGAVGGSSSFAIVIDENDAGCNYTFTPNDLAVVAEANCPGEVVYLPVDSSNFEIRNNERKYKLILISPKQNAGFYTVKFHIEREGESYGGTQMLWVTVP
jgi:hypothetical protein